jgi:hypothetical protein
MCTGLMSGYGAWKMTPERSKFRLGLQRLLYITLQFYYSKFLFPHLGDDSTLFDFLPFLFPQFEAVSSL